MNNNTYWSELLPHLRHRSVNEAVSSVFFQNEPLNRWLRRTLSESASNAKTPADQARAANALLGDPLFEAVFPWKQSGKSVPDMLREGLFSQETNEKLELVPPYSHQLEAFRLLLARDKRNSVVISSGTGSGKTECFMLPIIEDLVREQTAGTLRRKGIRALFLYPLNALINSQRDRLTKFTQPFGGSITYCLYTGELEEARSDQLQKYQQDHPEELPTRKAMREKVPHLLLTNSSMLERMLLRPKDQPMIEATKKHHTFRWIVLDEAHTYIGTRAAEMALLLRRVLNAFDTDPSQVHFVATSATVASDNREAQEKLRRFLADLSGAPLDNIHLILGERSLPKPVEVERLHDDEALDDLFALKNVPGDDGLAAHLRRSRTAMRIRNEFIRAPHYLMLSDLQQRIGLQTPEEALKWLDLLTAPEGKNTLLPLRLQQMMSTTDVFNVCPDPNCSAKDEELRDPAWRFGQVYLDGRRTCRCGAPLFPLAACPHCSAVSLRADRLLTADGEEKLVRPDDESDAAVGWMRFESEGGSDLEQSVAAAQEALGTPDEASNAPHSESEEARIEEMSEPLDASDSLIASTADADNAENASDDQLYAMPVLITNEPPSQEAVGFCLSWKTEKGEEKTAELAVRERQEDRRIPCPACGERQAPAQYYLRRISGRYANALIPLLLDYSAVPDNERAGDRPMSGKKLLSFTDSRQGTAKTAALIEREGERSFVLSRVSRMLTPMPMPETTQQEIERWRSSLGTVPPEVRSMIETQIQVLAAPYQGAKKPWSSVLEAISNEIESNKSGKLRNLLSSLRTNKTNCSPEEAADILLLREFGFRPVNGVNLETCGLVKVEYPALTNLNPPARLQERFTREEWQRYLKLVLDFFVRWQHAIAMPSKWTTLSGSSRVFQKTILPPNSENKAGKHQVRWPRAQLESQRTSRMVRLTAAILGIDLENATREKIDLINDVLEAAFRALKNEANILEASSEAGAGYCLDLKKSAVLAANDAAWRFEGCNQLFDTIVGDRCPANPALFGAVKVAIPKPPAVDFEAGVLRARNAVRTSLSQSDDYQKLIDLGVWNRCGTYALEQNGYFAAAEHTAQLLKDVRRSHERDFEKGFINVLASSTTMEMGIDLGEIGAVILHGVPPHPANYLQRIGRAGRRKETRINSLTICRSRSRDRAVFAEPDWALVEGQPEMNISLHSPVIVERHVAAELLSVFLMSDPDSHDGLDLKTWLNGVQDQFRKWLNEPASDLEKRLKLLVRRSCLEGRSFRDLVQHAADMIFKASKRAADQIEQYRRRKAEANACMKDQAYAASLSRQERRLENRNLLEYLTEELVLPSSIRVVNTLSFDPKISEAEDDGSKPSSRHRNLPSRESRTGLFEYAPGASVIISGTNYVSTGVQMDWTPPASEQSAQKIHAMKKIFSCRHCGHRFAEPISEASARCPNCGCETSFSTAAVLPTGFTVSNDDWPNKDLNTHQYVRTDPNISMDEPWTPLDSAGRIEARASGEASFLAVNEGCEKGQRPRRFALCLACGFAQLMPGEGECLDNWKRHRPIGPTSSQFMTQDGYCIGGTQGHQYLFEENIAFAAEWKTDCLQIRFSQLQGLFEDDADKTDSNPKAQRRMRFKSAGIGIAVSLRHAIAARFRISEDEILFTTTPPREGGSKQLVVSLFDRSMGGYCSAAADDLPNLFRAALKLLHCPNHCPDACSSCILQFDAERDGVTLNRHDALAVLQANGAGSLADAEAGFAGSETAPLARPFSDSFLALAESAGEGEAILFADGSNLDGLAPAATAVVSLAESLAKLPGIRTTIAAVGFEWKSLSSEAQNELHRLCSLNVRFAAAESCKAIGALPIRRSGFALSGGNQAEAGLAVLAAAFVSGSKTTPSSAAHAFVLCGPAEETASRADSWRYDGGAVRMLEGVTTASLLPKLTDAAPPTYQAPEAEVQKPAAGIVSKFSVEGFTFLNFGPKLLSAVCAAMNADALEDIVESTAEEVVYSDRYLERVGDAALVLSIFEALRASEWGAPETQFSIRTCVPKNRRCTRYSFPEKLYETWGCSD